VNIRRHQEINLQNRHKERDRMYEPIRGRDDAEEENKCGVQHSAIEDEDDVEMAVHARSSSVIPNAAGGFNSIVEETSKQKQQQQQRLVSLDVFRGITVAVMFPHPIFFLLCFSYSSSLSLSFSFLEFYYLPLYTYLYSIKYGF
jgi:hypothetical protein